jgi:hypothetical protein
MITTFRLKSKPFFKITVLPLQEELCPVEQTTDIAHG